MEWEDGVGDDFDNTFPDYQDENENPKKKILGQLPLNMFYEVLNNEEYDVNTSLTCTWYVADEHNNGSRFLRLCKQLEYKITHFIHITEQCNVSPENGCEYLKYWLQEQIENIDPTSFNVSALSQVFDIVFTAKTKYKCYYDKDKFKNGDFAKNKFFFDYSENLMGINNIDRNFTDLYDNFYCEYIKDGVNLYNDTITGPCKDKKCAYYDQLKHFQNIYNKHRISLCKKCNYNFPCLKNPKGEYEEGCSLLILNNEYPVTASRQLYTDTDNHDGVTFTPLPSLLRRRIMKKKNVSDNLDEETDQSLIDSEIFHSKSNKRSYHIQYHSEKRY
ncbi:PIR Superfamily Protein [Plasmodium ovale curtisi]|uniref:PIR Superfamily Protein n=1 Tax=Plasmodium ovale curtisi TaxID=864141 RepID=A0A1A8XCB3_PLAOA|nr:PIR Superfamily Protein [Plasmodium ovale curtisi]